MSLKELLKINIPRSGLIIFLYLIYAIAGSMGEYLFKYALNAITVGHLNTYLFWQIVEAVMEVLAALLLPVATVVFTRQTQNYLHKIRQDIVQHYYVQGDEKVANMQNELTANLKLLTDKYANSWITILSGLFEIIIAIGLLVSMNWLLIVVTAVLAVLTLYLPKLLEKKTSAAMDQVNQKHQKLLAAIEYWLIGLQELRRYSAYGRLSRQLKKASGDYAEAGIKSEGITSWSYLINGVGNTLAQFGLGITGGLLFIFGKISFGDFVVASGFAFTIFSGIWDITDSLTKVKSTKTLRAQTAELRKKLADHAAEKVPVFSLSVKNLKVKYDQGEEIAYPDFEIKKGQKVLLSGDSGTGKSTLFKVLLGELKPETGTITYYDQSGNIIPNEKAKLNFMPQDPIVFPVSIKDNITMFKEELADKLGRITQAVQLQPDLAKMPAGLDTQVDLKTENLSGGQRQKVVLARTEIHEQPFVLMDEVTSAIDQEATEKIIDNLLQTNQTILMIAHNFTPELKKKFDQEIKLTAKRKENKE